MSEFRNLSFLDMEVLSELPRYRSLRALARGRGLLPNFVSKKVHEFEILFDVQLLRRSATGVVPTSACLKLSELASRILATSEGFKFSHEAGAAGYEAQLNVGSRGFMNAFFAGSLACSFGAGFPELGLRFLDMSPEEAQVAAVRGLLDMVITMDRLEISDLWWQEEIGELRWGLYGRKGHPLEFGATPSDLARFRMLRQAYFDGEKVVEGAEFAPLSARFKVFGHEIQSAAAALGVVTSSDQLAFLPVIAVQAFRADGVVSEISVEGMPSFVRPLFLGVRNSLSKKVLDVARTSLSDALCSSAKP